MSRAKDNLMHPKGILEQCDLPNKTFDDLWERIFVADEVKSRLISQVLLEFTIRDKINSGALPLHGIILLVGPPGTGKTSLAKGIASRAASLLRGKKVRFVQVEPHSLTSSSLGKSQREVTTFLSQTITEIADSAPLIVLLDEVETLAANRSRMSLEANPIDVHRATDALLAGLDTLAARFPHLLFIATSNFEGALDPAFISRADLVERIDKPDKDTCEKILKDTIEILARKWPKLKQLQSNTGFQSVAADALGLDGRQIRKAVLRACTFNQEVALDINHLSIDDLHKAIKMAKENGV
jgi:SpoVK/Ycf46/Vps4 family AAA+-type ATPase